MVSKGQPCLHGVDAWYICGYIFSHCDERYSGMQTTSLNHEVKEIFEIMLLHAIVFLRSLLFWPQEAMWISEVFRYDHCTRDRMAILLFRVLVHHSRTHPHVLHIIMSLSTSPASSRNSVNCHAGGTMRVSVRVYVSVATIMCEQGGWDFFFFSFHILH